MQLLLITQFPHTDEMSHKYTEHIWDDLGDSSVYLWDISSSTWIVGA